LALKKKLLVDGAREIVEEDKEKVRNVATNLELYCGKCRDSYTMARRILGFERELLRIKEEKKKPSSSKLESYVVGVLPWTYSNLIDLTRLFAEMKRLHDEYHG
jgi:hypothetical protein